VVASRQPERFLVLEDLLRSFGETAYLANVMESHYQLLQEVMMMVVMMMMMMVVVMMMMMMNYLG
jgi:hypothetical protein